MSVTLEPKLATGRHRLEPDSATEVPEDTSGQYVAPGSAEPSRGDGDPAAEEQGQAGSQPTASFLEVPAGFRSVAWLRPEEAESALHAYSGRGDVPIWKNHKVTGWARYHRSDTELARKYRANVHIERMGAAGPRIVCWVRDYDANAVIDAVRLRRDVPFDGAVGRRPGLVQYFPPDSDSAKRFRSVTRLLRARAGGWDGLEDGDPDGIDETTSGAMSPRPSRSEDPGPEQGASPLLPPMPMPSGARAADFEDSDHTSPPLQPGYAISMYARGEPQALIRWVLADGQRRSYEELVAAACQCSQQSKPT